MRGLIGTIAMVSAVALVVTAIAVGALWMVAASLTAKSVMQAKEPTGRDLVALAEVPAANFPFASRPVTDSGRRQDSSSDVQQVASAVPPPATPPVQAKKGPRQIAGSVPPTAKHDPAPIVVAEATPMAAAPASAAPEAPPLPVRRPLEAADSVMPPAPPAPAAPEPAPKLAMAAPPAPPPPAAPAAAPEKHQRTADARTDLPSLPERDGRTAVYDIVAHAVFLPNGQRLVAHSGLGSKIDDPRYVSVRNQGPTPPNVYNLVLREQIFHGVRALRLVPVGGGKMYGRDGILAHSYMLGPSGQSNGCVSFSNYPAFLHAYLKGDVDKLVVVSHLAGEPARAVRTRRGRGARYAFNEE